MITDRRIVVETPTDIDATWFLGVLVNGTPNMSEAQRFTVALDRFPQLKEAALALIANRIPGTVKASEE